VTSSPTIVVFLTVDSPNICTAAVVKHFDDFHEDQFDFHAYCVRKVTLRAYTDVLKFEDNLWGEDYYFTAAEGSIRIYLQLHDNPDMGNADAEPDYSKMTAAEKKKAKAISRKKKAQAEKEAEKRKQEPENAENGGGHVLAQQKKGKSPVEEDAEGKDLLKKDPLEEAKKYSAILSKHCPNRLEAWVLQYDVAIRRKKLLLALQALIKMKSLEPNSAGYISRLVDFSVKLPSFQIEGAVGTVLTEESSKLLSGNTVAGYVTELACKARVDPTTPLPVRVAIAESLVVSKSESAATAAAIIVEGGIHSRGVCVESCRAALTALKGFGSEASESTKQWINVVKHRFHLAKEFS
jgi:ribosomal protein S17E